MKKNSLILFAIQLLVLSLVKEVVASSPITPNEHIGDYQTSEITKQLGIDQNLGDQVPGDLEFYDETGVKKRLHEFFGGSKPIVLMPVFYECSSACNTVLDQMLRTAIRMKSRLYSIGNHYKIITFSIKPTETVQLAANKKTFFTKLYNDSEGIKEWKFLTGDWNNIQKLTKSIGFRFIYDEKEDNIQHPAGIMILTPSGKISSYFYGVSFEPKIMRDRLVNAAREEVGTKAEEIMFGCIHIDPVTGQKSLNILKFIQLCFILTVITIVGSIIYMTVNNKRKKNNTGAYHS